METGSTSGDAVWSGGCRGPKRCRLYAATFGGPEDAPGRFIAAGGGDGANEVKVRRIEQTTWAADDKGMSAIRTVFACVYYTLRQFATSLSSAESE